MKYILTSILVLVMAVGLFIGYVAYGHRSVLCQDALARRIAVTSKFPQYSNPKFNLAIKNPIENDIQAYCR